MTRVFRLIRRAFCTRSSDAFSAVGSQVAGGRWHSKGAQAVYAACSPALAALEVFANIDRENAPIDYVLISAIIAEASDIEQLCELPSDWRTPSRSALTVELGESFLREHRALALAVPSVLIPQETDYLINLEHTRFASLQIRDTMESFPFDERVFSQHCVPEGAGSSVIKAAANYS